MKIATLMVDREFIGDAWMAYLQREKIPFILRLRGNIAPGVHSAMDKLKRH